jgi:hypothetical protein
MMISIPGGPTVSDFRIVLAPDLEFSDRELDWIEESHRWRLSDKERGSVTWFFDRDPTLNDLEALRDFFEIPSGVSTDELVRLSPGELAVLHAERSDPLRVRAVWCPTCRQHWIVYRYSGTAWLKYGRKCGEGWWLGDKVGDDEAMIRVES